MAELSYPFDSAAGDIRQHPSSFLAGVVFGVTPDGVIPGLENELAISAGAGLTVDVATGRAFVRGRYYQSTAIKNLALATADPTNPRIDRVVVRMDNSAGVRLVTTEVLTGTPAGAPVAPALTQTASLWEMSLAQVAVAAGATSPGTITDERTFTQRGEPQTLGGQEFGVSFVLDGGGAVITAGMKGWVRVPFAGNIDQSSIVADASGSLSITVRKAPFANFPGTMTTLFTTALATQQKREDARDSDLVANDIVEFEVTGTPATITLATISLKGLKT